MERAIAEMNLLPDHLAQEVQSRLLEGQSTRQICGALLVAKGTVDRYRAIVRSFRKSPILCQCGREAGHKGWCAVRLARSPARQAFIATWNRSGNPAIIRIKSPPRFDMAYPFIPPRGADGSGVDLLLLVNGMVPKGLPEQLRGDVCQEIILSVLSGELAQADIPTEIRRFIRLVRKTQEAHYMAFSIDAPRRGGGSWHEYLPAPDHETQA